MRAFRLVSRWHLPADVDTVWGELADPAFTWPRWWPGLTADEVSTPGGRVVDGWSSARVRVRSPLGWTLRFLLVLVSSDPPDPGPPPAAGRALLRATGDLSGTADVVVAAAPGGTEVALTWAVDLARDDVVGRLLRTLPRPALAATHAAVMRAGERGLTTRLTAGA
ncbi:hypothetical protein ET495_07340 [Xylanimonas allomyrinae]|uniref:Polyketide cyclase n=1 Tax=Xylanimonas allomyrinae TaxID=2509459 RepID=A0A4P6ERS5_9MICO|nr:hypothetical protein [Xylanimonas allomyrinae]QAY63087.1 hypothetical protein ET495_07340 [Xylanimonas allomyrinae]